MKHITTTLAMFLVLFSLAAASADENGFTPAMEAANCKLWISAYKKTKAATGGGENSLIIQCPGYKNLPYTRDNLKLSGSLFSALGKKPKRVKVAGAGALTLWEDLLLIGTPRKIANQLLDEPEFWNAVKEVNKHPVIIKRNARKGIVTN